MHQIGWRRRKKGIPIIISPFSIYSDTLTASQQHHVLPTLPSPPPTIVQSVIPTTPTISHTPIVAPIPKPQMPQTPHTPQMHQISHQPQTPYQMQPIQQPQMPQPVPAPRIEIKPNICVSSNFEHTSLITSAPITVRTMTTASPTVTTVAPPFLSSSNVVYSEQQMTTIHTSSAQNQNSNKLAQEQENEQFALAWLRATFEPVSALASRIEQQDLYKMYLTACSKIGRTGVVSQYHFPRCVRNVFGGTVGPNQIKIKQNAISSFFYEGIRIRAQPLAVVHKGTILVSANANVRF